MGKYAITEEDEAARRKAEIRAAKRDVRKSNRREAKLRRQARRSKRKILRKVKTLARKAHRDYRQGGSGEAAKRFRVPCIFTGWEECAKNRAAELGVVMTESFAQTYYGEINLTVKVVPNQIDA